MASVLLRLELGHGDSSELALLPVPTRRESIFCIALKL